MAQRCASNRSGARVGFRTCITSSSARRSVARPGPQKPAATTDAQDAHQMVVWSGVVDRLLKMGRRRGALKSLARRRVIPFATIVGWP